jgi:hypothetical protein
MAETQQDQTNKQIKEVLSFKPVREAISDIETLRREMFALYAHGQFAAPERVLKLTARIDLILRRMPA